MYLFFDTETTGVPQNRNASASDLNNWPRLVQLAYLVFNEQGDLLDKKNHIIKPDGFTIPKVASDIHGITTEDAIIKGSALKFVLDEFIPIIQKAKYLVAHNMAFDEKIVGAELIRNNYFNIIEIKSRICTMLASKDFCALSGPSDYKWPTLPELHFKLFNSNFNHSHNALVDIEATAKCFWELKKRKVIMLAEFHSKQSEKLAPILVVENDKQTNNSYNHNEVNDYLYNLVLDNCYEKVSSNQVFDFEEIAIKIYCEFSHLPTMAASYIKILPTIIIEVLNKNGGFDVFFMKKGLSIDKIFRLKHELKSQNLDSITARIKELMVVAVSKLQLTELNLESLIYFLNLCFPDRSKEKSSERNAFMDTKSLLSDLQEFNISLGELHKLYIKALNFLPLIEEEKCKYSPDKKSTQIGIVKQILYVTHFNFLKNKKLPLEIKLFYQQWNFIIETCEDFDKFDRSKIPDWTYFDFDTELLIL